MPQGATAAGLQHETLHKQIKMKILVVDDEQDICDILQYNLELEGYDVDTANSAEEAMCLPLACYSLLLLDVMMGEISGFKLAKRLKDSEETASIPIIFITALDSEENTVRGLELGADDYIVKPLSMKEVVARVKAVLRRTSHIHTPSSIPSAVSSSDITYETMSINMDAKTVSIDGEIVTLTKIEFELLRYLVCNAGRVFSRDDLLKHCWPSDTYVLDRTVDVNITRLRKKIGRYGKQIRTRFGYGYTFEK